MVIYLDCPHCTRPVTIMFWHQLQRWMIVSQVCECPLIAHERWLLEERASGRTAFQDEPDMSWWNAQLDKAA
jgi:hypothetical protein